MIKYIIYMIIIIGIGSSYFIINKINYKKTQEIRENYIHHPERLPKKNILKYNSFGFKNMRADLYWIEAIQYIGGNAMGAEYKKYLYHMLDIITELNPYFESPYIIGQLLLPSFNYRYETFTPKEQDLHITQGVNLGLKGMKNFCDLEKIERIKKEDNLQKIWTQETLMNPCQTYSIPYYLAFIYYYYKKDHLTASTYYKIASANQDALDGIKSMAAIMQSKGGQRKKSYFMFINIAKHIEPENNICGELSQLLEQAGMYIFHNNTISLSSKLLQELTQTKNKIFGTFTKEKEDTHLGDTQCVSYINKAIRELNLSYLDNANMNYKNMFHSKDGLSAKQLLKKGYIDYIPKDFQQYENYGIMYEYDNELGYFSYTMRNYDEW